MATRYVFKFFNSIGPAGSLVGLAEKICTAVYPHAYNFGDESQLESEIDKEIKISRSTFVNEMFNQKNKLLKKTKPEIDQEIQEEAWKVMVDIVIKHIAIAVRLHKNKYMRDRLMY